MKFLLQNVGDLFGTKRQVIISTAYLLILSGLVPFEIAPSVSQFSSNSPTRVIETQRQSDTSSKAYEQEPLLCPTQYITILPLTTVQLLPPATGGREIAI
jgi:hypothetical protein